MRRPLCAALVLVVLAACASGGGQGGDTPDAIALNDQRCLDADRADSPVVGLIPAAIAAVEAHYGSPQRFFEVSADLERVSVIVAVDDATAAEQAYYCGAKGFAPPEPVGEASGSTFPAGAVDFDPDRIFDAVRAELDDPAIIDFAIQGTPEGTAIYDATVASDAGGVLLVLLGPTGQILGAQGQ